MKKNINILKTVPSVILIKNIDRQKQTQCKKEIMLFSDDNWRYIYNHKILDKL